MIINYSTGFSVHFYQAKITDIETHIFPLFYCAYFVYLVYNFITNKLQVDRKRKFYFRPKTKTESR